MKHEAIVPEDLWDAIEPFLPEEPPKPKVGGTAPPSPASSLRPRLSLLAPPAYGVKSRS
jgi:hypothetical protein